MSLNSATNDQPFRVKSTLSMAIFTLTLIVAILCFCHLCLADEINGADGSFEAGLDGYNAQGQVSVENALGPLLPTDGNSFAMLTTAPDEGADLEDADASTLTLPSFQIPQGVTNLSFDVNFLTNELTPAFGIDFFTATLIGPGGPNEIKRIDVFADFKDADGTGYKRQTGFLKITADVSQFAGSGDLLSLELKISDFGDGRRDSAALIDNIKLTPQLASIEVGIPDPSIGVGAMEQLSATGFFNDDSTRDMTNEVAWHSSRSGVAAINAAGEVMALARGATEITASKNDIISPGELLVVGSPQVVSITIAPTQSVIALGETQQYTAIGAFTDGSMANITDTATWTSSIANVATIDSTGLARGIADGRTEIRASKDDGVSEPAMLLVTKGRLVWIDIEPVDPVVPLGGALQLRAMGNFSDGTVTNIAFRADWESSDPKTAPVDENGAVTGLVEGGAAEITVSSRGVSGSETVTVGPPVLESIEILPKEPFVAAGDTLQMRAKGIYTDGSETDMTGTVIWTSSEPGVATIDPAGLAAGLTNGATEVTAETDDMFSVVMLTVGQNIPPVAVTVPWISAAPNIPHDTYQGKAVTLKGIGRDANSLSDLVSYQWNFGDGALSEIMEVTDPYALEAKHTYTGMVGTPFKAALTVWDNAGASDSDEYLVILRSKTLEVEVNVAVDEALWFLHKTQIRELEEDEPTGRWSRDGGSSVTNAAAFTGASVSAFENNGHLPGGDYDEDPYVETARRGLNWLLYVSNASNIAEQTYGNPDVNGNGIGIATSGYYTYEGCQALQAIAGSGDPTLIAQLGSAKWVKGRTYGDIAQDMVDMLSYGQADGAQGYESSRGGWRYGPGPSSQLTADMSAVQWAVIGLEAAERNFGDVVTVPDFVRTELDIFLNSMQNGSGAPGDDGGFGYQSNEGWLNIAKTASGILSLDWLTQKDPLPAGLDPDSIKSRLDRALDFVARNFYVDRLPKRWFEPPYERTNFGNMYAMWAFAKAARDAEVEILSSSDGAINIDWYQEYARWLIDNQEEDGAFPSERCPYDQISDPDRPTLRTAWGVLVLTPTVVNPPPVAVAAVEPAAVIGQDDTITFSHDKSFHRDPRRTIVLYEWDFDGDGAFDFQTDDKLARPTHAYSVPEEELPKDVHAILRVTDNNDPNLKDTDVVTITITSDNKPPVADIDPDDPDTDPEYAGLIDQIITLDGATSLDLDEGDSIVSYEWDLDESDGLTQFTDATGPTTTVSFSTLGDHGIGLRVTDSTGLTGTDFGVVRIVEQKKTIFDLSIRNRPKDRKIQLVWSPVDGAIGYNVLRSANRGGPYTKIGSPISSYVVFVDRDVTNEQTYYYVVRSVDANQIESLDSNEAEAMPTAIIQRRRR